ncbi:metal-dependent transcriptional regulator [Apibacter adventoris]|uniref:metal-dependent transcriptional regulator n=1 Tax=Apibacter adventoris TaxID=1679466 RepID=UPI000CF69239|nr:metal-dependent transcriptional regulator [Apibacter adventoris]PQL94931.1 iron (metal) dependent repressor, dtxr family protein [Apibacter adventoris]
MYSYVEENYLKALLALTNEKGEVSTLALSQSLNIKMPTVNSMMKKFSEKGLVHYQSYKPFKLTEKGLKEAGLILRKHRLTEIYLVEKMGFSWEEVHEIAEQLEHVHSDKFFEKMDKLLDYPKFDPHGSPIPDVDGKLEWVHYKKLSECKVGDKVLLAAVMNSSREFLKYLNSKKLTLGLELEVIQIEEFDKSMTLKIISSNRVEVLSNLVTEKLLIKNN